MTYSTNLESLTFEPHIDEIAVHELRTGVPGGVVLRSEESYAEARRVWNDAVQHRPAMIAFCQRAEDVQAAVRVARKRSLPLSVRGGGHDWAGRALRHDGLVIDLTRMRNVVVDPEKKIATVGGGATVKDVIDAAGVHGLVAAFGNCGAVGMAGLTLGGGYGPLIGKHGLAADNLLGAEVVLADGRHVIADAGNERELFWALRGGGGNFGVVTSLRIRLHRAGEPLAGLIVYPLSEAGMVMERYSALAATLPDEYGASLAMMSGPDGLTGLALMPLWDGETAEGEKVMRQLEAFGKPRVVQVAPMSYADVIGRSDPFVVYGFAWEIRNRWLRELTPGAIEVIAAAVARKGSPYSIVGFHPFHGEATRISAKATAFGMRTEHVLVQIIACWKPGEDDDASHRQWARQLWQNLAPFALPGGYANVLGPEDSEQAQHAYGGNGARLRTLKRRFDPDGVFASAIPLPTGVDVAGASPSGKGARLTVSS